jgi:hypothetical protein
MLSQSIEILDKSKISKNKIRTQTLWEYDYVNKKPEEKGSMARLDSFDILGNKVRQVNYRSNGSLHNYMTFKYDNKGRQIEYSKFSYENAESKLDLAYKQSIKFDSKNNKILETGFNGLDSFKIVYNYNKSVRLAEVNFFIKKKLDEKRSFAYTGDIADLKVADGEGALKFSQKNVYDDNGKLLEETRFETDKTISRKVIYTYDQKGNLTSEAKYIKGKFIGKIYRIYNSKGLLSEVYQEDANSPKYLINKYIYDDRDLLTEDQSRTSATDEFSKKKYTYDQDGIIKAVDSYYAEYKKQVLSIYLYTFY